MLSSATELGDDSSRVDKTFGESSKDLSAVHVVESSAFAILAELSNSRKGILLLLFCLGLFLDCVNNTSLYSAIPVISNQLNIPNSQAVWILSAYQLTFAALLLVSGRASDIYNPKWVFIIGVALMSIFALVDGFIRSEIPMIVFRAFQGSGAALTVPAAQHLIVQMYPDPAEQARAITIYGAMGGIGIVLGLVIGALFVSYASWPWVYYFSAIVCGVITFAILILVPNAKRSDESETRAQQLLRFRRLDLPGLTAYAVALILFIFAITSGSSDGWGSAKVIAPLVISVFVAGGFFLWEALIPEYYAALPPKMWKYENLTILTIISLVPVMWWTSVFLLFAFYWEDVYGWSAINVAVHFLPIGIGIFPIVAVAGSLQTKLRLKWVLMIGHVLIFAGTLLLPFANSKKHYWRLAFPGFLLGTSGAALIYATTNVALLAITPPEVSGIVSAVFNCFLQTGAAAGNAIITSIETSVQQQRGGPSGFAGRAAGLWFLVAVLGLVMLLFLVFMKDTVGPVGVSPPPAAAEKAEYGDEQELADPVDPGLVA
ncbi:major facilitator superfamily domain-containing protein [Amylocystis lapponica]|nr:major facilitator superfamily domain-containing protein [Amylocystis lapponica]